MKDLSDYTREDRYDIARRVLKYAPFLINMHILTAYREALKQSAENIAKIEKIIHDLDACGADSTEHRKLFDLAITEFERLQASNAFISEGSAWNMADEGIRADDVSNSFVHGNLLSLAQIEMNRLNASELPVWYEKIVNAIMEVTGIDIRILEVN